MLDHGENEPERKTSKMSKKGKKKAELADLKKEIELVRMENFSCEHSSYFRVFVSLIVSPLSVICSTGLAYDTYRRVLSET
jgi:hypothetical protein